MKPAQRAIFGRVAIECAIYVGLVVAYVLLVLHLLGGWLHSLFLRHRPLYAGVSVGLVLAQGFLLEQVTRGLIRFIRPRRKQ